MITFFTIVLDGEPWIERHYPVFQTLTIPWRWIVVEGVAGNKNCTSWCAGIAGRISTDGTHEYLKELAFQDQRVNPIFRPYWPNGKVQMCNTALAFIDKPCLLWQVDSDELWTKEQIEKVAQLMAKNPQYNCADFYCRYFVGPARYVEILPNSFGNHCAYEWRRVWRFEPGMRFKTHEPPVIEGQERHPLTHEVTKAFGCVFDHYAYATLKSMEFRSVYYAGANNPNAHLWRNCLEGWDRLQQATLPCKLKDYFPWVDDKATVVAL